MSQRPFTLAAAVVCLQLASPTDAQSQAIDSGGRVRAYLDCQVHGCDDDYFRREIVFVDHMRDRADASIHVLVTSARTGSSGTAYVLNFIGLRQFAALSDTIRFTVPESATADDRRTKLAQYLKLGLIRYVARGGSAEGLSVSYLAPTARTVATAPSIDRWNYWVFRTRANANLNGEKSQRSAYLNGSQSANRTTKDWKIRMSLNQSYSESKFSFESGNHFSSYSHSYGLSQLVVKSVTPHLSAGEQLSLSSSTYLNQQLAARAGPAVEYDLFPYDESSRRQLTLQYSVGLSHFQYRDTTIFGKLSETRPDHALTLGVGFTQPWGSINTSLTGRSLLDDFSKNSLGLFSSADLRLFKGLSFNFFVSASRVRDQLYLAKGGATDQQVLVRQRQLATSYRYFAGLGLSYTFGSIFNNVVNTRFDAPGGGF